MSLSVDALQFESAAPKSEATVSPPVEDALVKLMKLEVSVLEERDVAVVVAKNVLPDTVRAEVEALERVVFPVTLSVEEKIPVVPVIAPKDATVE
jgi:hypothetical protein